MNGNENLSVDEQRTVGRIRSILRSDRLLSIHQDDLSFAVERQVIVVRGHLPTHECRDQIASVIRRAGVLARIDNQVEVSSAVVA